MGKITTAWLQVNSGKKMQSDFISRIKSASNYDLYKLAKSLLIREMLGEKQLKERIELVYEESILRDKAIFGRALEDAINISNSLNFPGTETRITQIQPLGLINRDETASLLSTLSMKDAGLQYDGNVVPEINPEINIDSDELEVCEVSGDSMIGARIHDGDKLLVNKNLTPIDGDIIVAKVDGALFVKRYKIINGTRWLFPENEDYDALKLGQGIDYEFYGVVKHVFFSV